MSSSLGALLRLGWRSFRPTVAAYGLGSVSYVFLLMWLYPSIAHAPGLQALLRTLPKSLVASTGLVAGLGSPLAYLTSEFYGTLYLWLLMIFTVVGIVRLIAQGPHRGSAGAWLAGPVSRPLWVLSQGGIFWGGLLITCGLVTAAEPVAMAIWEPQQVIPVGTLLLLNGMVVLVFTVLAGAVAVCAAAISDDQRALAVAALFTMIQYVLSVVGGLTAGLAWMRRLSLFYWYRPAAIVLGAQQLGFPSLVLLVMAMLLWGTAAWLFRRRDLLL
ncbi:MAG: hypothetical protein M0Z53_02100 [Thermaerobacter sp.]|nr:hypothetical protein [Thermaerobacter sp.]